MVGGIGIAPGGNINYKTGHAIFEATHGTAPDIAGKNKANPCSLILSSVMALEYLNMNEAALYDHSSKRIKIDSELFQKYNVKKGLRNEDGTGVLVGLTNIGDVVGYERDKNGKVCPIDGKLYYRGYDLNDIANDILTNKRFGYEEVCYLLLSGKLPDMERLQSISDNMYLDKKTIMNI